MIRHFAAAAILLLGTACGVKAASEDASAETVQASPDHGAASTRDAIRRVMVEESMSNAGGDRRRTATSLARIDVAGTPAAFREAWGRYVAAQVELADLSERSNSRETAERRIRAASERSERAVADYTEIARRYGALSGTP